MIGCACGHRHSIKWILFGETRVIRITWKPSHLTVIICGTARSFESGGKFGEKERCSFHANFHFMNILKSSVNNYCTDPRQQGIYSFYIITSKILLR